MSIMKVSRRGFVKAAAFACGYSLLGFNMAKQAFAQTLDFVGLRQKAVYDADANIYELRKSQDNPMIVKLYASDGFLSEGPCGHTSHHLLHTHYFDRSAKIAALKARGITLSL